MKGHAQRSTERANIVLENYAPEEPASQNLRDLLTDLRHWCDAEGVDFHDAVDRSYQVYLEERAEDADAEPEAPDADDMGEDGEIIDA